MLLVREIGENSAKTNLARITLAAKVGTVGESVFVDNWAVVEELRAQDQFQSLVYRGLPDTVSAGQQDVMLEHYTSLWDAAGGVDLKPSGPHSAPSLFRIDGGPAGFVDGA